MILAILLGPYAAFLVMASVLTVQALFFADGGLLALGCNIFNLGFFPCFVAYPLIFKPIVKGQATQSRILGGAIVSAVIGLQLGAFGVVLETYFSGITELPFGTFVLLMQPIHLAIGIVEGLVTAAVVGFVWKARPDIVAAVSNPQGGRSSMRTVLIGLSATAIICGGALSWFASAHPDGLEWAMFKTSGSEELGNPEHGLHESLAHIQNKTAFLPDYGFKSQGDEPKASEESHTSWPAVDAGTSVAGLVGGILTLFMAAMIGLGLKRLKKSTP
jgi:cobalt/nickel transport system permease protein